MHGLQEQGGRIMTTVKAYLFGNYYETINGDARILAKNTGLALTNPNPHYSSPFDHAKVLCGFPMHALESIQAKLKQVGVKLELHSLP